MERPTIFNEEYVASHQPRNSPYFVDIHLPNQVPYPRSRHVKATKAYSLSMPIRGEGETLIRQQVSHNGHLSTAPTVESTMRIHNFRISLESSEAPDFIDITDQIVDSVQETGVTSGNVLVYSMHTTAAIKINEMEPLLLEDLARTLEHIAPRDADYRHNDFTVRTVNMNEDECPNGHAHCQHLTLGTSETIAIIDGAMQLGTYQRIFFIELDHPRQREILIQVMGF